MVEFSKLPGSWKITLGAMTGNVVISEVMLFDYFVLRKEEKHVSYGEIVCITEGMTL